MNKLPKVIGVTGFLGSGKDTVAQFITEHYPYTYDSFAAPLKDACSSIFGWDRSMVEGSTDKSREWRNEVDNFWAEKLNDPTFTPRKALQLMGTEVMREGFCDDIWILSLQKRIIRSKNNIIITDCRFPNEISLIKNMGGKVFRVKRGHDPMWFNLAKNAIIENNQEYLQKLREHVHPSEYSWIASDFDATINNDGNLNDLKNTVMNIMKGI